MAKTFRITIEYTSTEDEVWKHAFNSPDHWDWTELLDLDPTTETFSVWVNEVETNENHVRYIKEENDFTENK